MTVEKMIENFDPLCLQIGQKVKMKEDCWAIAQQVFDFCRESGTPYENSFRCLGGKTGKINTAEERYIDHQKKFIYGIDNFPYIIAPEMIECAFEEQKVEIDCTDLI